MGEALAALREALPRIARRAAYVQITEIVKMDRAGRVGEALNRAAGKGVWRRHWPQKVSGKEFEYRDGGGIEAGFGLQAAPLVHHSSVIHTIF
jgi:hypothetical protein